MQRSPPRLIAGVHICPCCHQEAGNLLPGARAIIIQGRQGCSRLQRFNDTLLFQQLSGFFFRDAHTGNRFIQEHPNKSAPNAIKKAPESIRRRRVAPCRRDDAAHRRHGSHTSSVSNILTGLAGVAPKQQAFGKIKAKKNRKQTICPLGSVMLTGVETVPEPCYKPGIPT